METQVLLVLLFLSFAHTKVSLITSGVNRYVLPKVDVYKPQVCLVCRTRSDDQSALANGINGTLPTLRVVVGETVLVKTKVNDTCVVEKTSIATGGRTDVFGPYGLTYAEMEGDVSGTCAVVVNKHGEVWRITLQVCVDEALAAYGEGYPPYCCIDNYDGTVSQNKGRRWRIVDRRVVEKEGDEENSACKDSNFPRDAFLQYDSHERSQPPQGMVVPRFGRRRYHPLFGDGDPLEDETDQDADLGYSMMCVMSNTSVMVPYFVNPAWPSDACFPPALLKLRFIGGGGYFGGVREVARDFKGPVSGFGYNARTASRPDMTWQFCDRYLADSSCFVDNPFTPKVMHGPGNSVSIFSLCHQPF